MIFEKEVKILLYLYFPHGYALKKNIYIKQVVKKQKKKFSNIFSSSQFAYFSSSNLSLTTKSNTVRALRIYVRNISSSEGAKYA